MLVYQYITTRPSVKSHASILMMFGIGQKLGEGQAWGGEGEGKKEIRQKALFINPGSKCIIKNMDYDRCLFMSTSFSSASTSRG